jgi:RNA polymerase sigma-70 factor (ECF subfamily)
MSAAEEQQLMLQAREGSNEAFRLLVGRHMKSVYNVAFGFVNDHDAAEDVAQETFVRAFSSLKSFRGDAQFGTWLYRIATNLALNRVKQEASRARREIRIYAPAIHELQSTEEGTPSTELEIHIERALHELPTLQRAVVLLRHFEGLSTKQVSEILRCSEGTVKTHLFRGMEKLRKKLQHLRDEPR